MNTVLIRRNNLTLSVEDEVELSEGLESKVTRHLEFLVEIVSEYLLAKRPELSLPLLSKAIEVELALTICHDEKIKTLNRDYREKDKVTDVLSFPVHESLRSDAGSDFPGEVMLDLGHIFVCHSVIQKQANEFELSYSEELIHLAVHGFLHLLGFDHEVSEKEEEIMESLEKELIEKISKSIRKRNGSN